MALQAVVFRELQEAARRKRTFVVRVAYAGLLAGVIVFTFLSVYSYQRNVGFQQAIGARLFQIFVYWQFALVVLLVPASAASSIVEERNSGTLPLLLLTNLTPGRIMLGKLAAEFSRMMFLLLSGIPVLFFTTMFGGVAPDQILGAFVVTAATMLLLAALGLAVSAFSQKTNSAIGTAYLLVLLFGILLPVLLTAGGVFWRQFSPLLKTIGDLLLSINPGYALAIATSGQGTWLSCSRFVVFAAVGAGALVLLGRYGIVHRLLREGGGAKQPRLSFLRKSRVARIRGEVRGHPIVWREAKTNWIMLAIFFLVLLVSAIVLSVVYRKVTGRWVHGIAEICSQWREISVLLWVIFLVAVMGRASNLFSEDKEQGVFPLLLLTPMSDRSIVNAKYLVLVKEFKAYVLALLLYVVLAIKVSVGLHRHMTLHISDKSVEAFFRGSVLAVGTLLFVTTVSLWWSLIAETAAKARIYTIVSLVAFYFLLSFLSVFMLRHSGVGEFAFVILPLVIAISLYDWMYRNLRRYATK